MRIISLALLTFILSYNPAHALFTEGNDLLRQCEDAIKHLDPVQPEEKLSFTLPSIRAAYNFGACFAYVQGIADTIRLYKAAYPDALTACLPKEGLKTDQAVRVVLMYLNEHPEELHELAPILALISLKEAFPCEAQEG